MLVLFYCLFSIATAQEGTDVLLSNNITANIFQINTITPSPDPTSPNYPNDIFISLAYTSDHLFTLASNNLIQVYNKTNLTTPLQIFSNYSFGNNLPFELKDLTVEEASKTIVCASVSGGNLQHLVFEYAN